MSPLLCQSRPISFHPNHKVNQYNSQQYPSERSLITPIHANNKPARTHQPNQTQLALPLLATLLKPAEKEIGILILIIHFISPYHRPWLTTIPSYIVIPACTTPTISTLFRIPPTPIATSHSRLHFHPHSQSRSFLSNNLLMYPRLPHSSN